MLLSDNISTSAATKPMHDHLAEPSLRSSLLPSLEADQKREAYFAECLKAAEAFIASSLFATVAKFTMPLSAQVKEEVRDRFEEDGPTYDRADQLQRSAVRMYGVLRIWTAAFFAVFLYLIVLADGRMWPGATARLGLSGLDTAKCIAVALAALAVCFGIRFVLRLLYLNVLMPKIVEKLAYEVSIKFKNIVADTNMACGQIDNRNDRDIGLTWPDRGWGWVKIALWSAARGSYLDRYTTIVFWKMQVSDLITERVTRLFKGFMLIAALTCVFYGASTPEQRTWLIDTAVLSVCVIWPAFWYFVFIWIGRQRTGKWNLDFAILVVLYIVFFGRWEAQGTGLIDWRAFILGAILVTAFWFGWIVWLEKSDDLWTTLFIEELKKGQSERANTGYYFNSLASRIRNLIQEVLDAHRIHGQAASPKDAGGNAE